MRIKETLVAGEYYHVFNKSIAGFRIFNGNQEYERMIHAIEYYQLKNTPCSLRYFFRLIQSNGSSNFEDRFSIFRDQKDRWVKIIAYCLMPTHVHFLLQQLVDQGISTFMGNILNSYARYFNTKHKRMGPLWAGRFKNVLIKTDDQFMHLTRYIHLNPTSGGLVKSPEDWLYSSYREYLNQNMPARKLCYKENVIDIPPHEYKKFVEDQKGYQMELERIKHLLLV